MQANQRRQQLLRPTIDFSPYFPRTEEAGAVRYIPYNRTHWPVDFGRDPREEVQAVNERAVLIDVGCERIAELRGPDALAFADYLCTRDLSTLKPGQARHTAICEPTGELYCEAIVLQPRADLVWVGHGPVDFLQWARAIAAHSSYEVSVERGDVFPLALQGPRALDIMRALAPEAAELRFFRWAQVTIAGVAAIVVRSGWTGSFGYEIFPFSSERALDLWDRIVSAGEPHGLLISPMTGPHFERGVTDFTYGGGLGLNPFELRLARAVDLDAGPFVGKEALQRIVQDGVRRKLVGLRFASDQLPPLEEFWPIEDEHGQLGVVQSVTQSLYLNQALGHAVVDVRAAAGSQVTVRHSAGSVHAELVELPFIA